jgi:hypothetical protein
MSFSALFTSEQKTTLNKPIAAAGVIPRFNGAWYFNSKSDKVFDFGGKKIDGEVFIGTAIREFAEESGLLKTDITRVYGVYSGPYYGVVLVEVNKPPLALEPGTTLVTMERYSAAEVSGRLYITGLQRAMRAVETAEENEQQPLKPDTPLVFSDLFLV